MTIPNRIQLHRTLGWRKPAGAIVVSRGTRWGNPFRVGEQAQISADGEIAIIEITPAIAVAGYRDLMTTRLLRDPTDMPDDAAWVEQWHTGLTALAGHDLACWCPLDQPCHADILLALANPGDHLLETVEMVELIGPDGRSWGRMSREEFDDAAESAARLHAVIRTWLERATR